MPRFVKIPKANKKYTDMETRDFIAMHMMKALVVANNGDACMMHLGAAKDAYMIADNLLKASEIE